MLGTIKEKLQNLRFLWKYAKKYKFDISLSLLFVLFSTGCMLYVGALISDLIKLINETSNVEDLVLWKCFEIIGYISLAALAIFGRIYYFGRLGEKLIKDLRDKLFKHILCQDISYFESQRTGELVSRIMGDTHVMQLVFVGSFSSAVRNLILLLGSSIMMVWISKSLFCLIFILSTISLVPSFYFGKKIRQLSRLSQEKSADVSSTVEETFNSIRTTRANSYEAEQQKRFEKATTSECNVVCSRIAFFGLSTTLNMILAFLIPIVGILFAYLNPHIHGLGLSQLSAFAYYLAIAGYSLIELNNLLGSFYRASGSSDRIRELFRIKPSICIPSEPLRTRHSEDDEILRFDKVDFAYPSQLHKNTLTNISFSIHKGQQVGIVGPSGSGKSTLFALMQRFYVPSSGVIFFNNQDLSLINTTELRNSLAMVEQDPFIYSTTIKENIRLGYEKASDYDLEKAAIAAHCDEFIFSLPDGYNTYVGEKGIRLSGGQKQRIALARAILRNSKMLLLDEATSSLDSESEKLIENALRSIMKECTSLIIAHRLSTVTHCDKIIFLDGGKIGAIGTHEELLHSAERYRKLVNMQFLRPNSKEVA